MQLTRGLVRQYGALMTFGEQPLNAVDCQFVANVALVRFACLRVAVNWLCAERRCGDRGGRLGVPLGHRSRYRNAILARRR